MLQQIEPFVGPEINWFAFSPMLTLLVGTLVLMLVGALTPQWPKGLYAFATATIAGAAGVLAMVQWDDITDNGTRTLVGGVIADDTLSMFITITICIGVILVALLSDDYLRGTPNDGPEMYALYMVAAIGGIVMALREDVGLSWLIVAAVVLLGAIANQRQGAGRWVFGAGAVTASFCWFGALGFGARFLAPLFESVRAWRVLDGLIALTMWALAAALLSG